MSKAYCHDANIAGQHSAEPLGLASLWWTFIISAIASSFYIVGAVSLTKLGFAALALSFLAIKCTSLFRQPLPSSTEVMLLLFILFSGITVFYAVNTAVSFAHYLSLVSCLVLYLIVRSLLAFKPQRVVIFLAALVAAAVVSSIFGILQVSTGKFFVPGTEYRSMTAGDSFRANGLFDDPNYFGYVLTISWPLVLMIFSRKKILRSTISLFLFVAVVLTYSRATILIVFIQLVAMIGLFSRSFLKMSLRISSFFFLVSIVVVLLNPFGILARMMTIVPLMFDAGGEVENSAAERFDLIFAGAKMFLDHFWLGVGFGNFQLLSAEYMSFYPRDVYAHNTYLTVAAESGILGASLYGLFLFALGYRLFQSGYIYLLVSYLGLLLSNFFLVAHYFPIAYLYLATIMSYRGSADRYE